MWFSQEQNKRFKQDDPARISTVNRGDEAAPNPPFLLLTATAVADSVTSSGRVSLAGCVAQRQPQPPPLFCTESISLWRQEALRGPFPLKKYNTHRQSQRPQSSCLGNVFVFVCCPNLAQAIMWRADQFTLGRQTCQRLAAGHKETASFG